MPRLAKEIALVLLLPVIPAVAAALWHPRAPVWTEPALRPGEVTLQTVRGWSAEVLWIDARSRDAYDAGHIDGALWLSEDAWDESLMPVLEAWRPGMKVVVYCDSRTCDASHAVAQRLREDTGWPDIHVLHGGWPPAPAPGSPGSGPQEASP